MVPASRFASGLSPLVRGLSACVFAACLFAAGCSRPAKSAVSEEYPGSFAEGAVLRLEEGVLTPGDAGGSSPGTGAPGGLAPCVAAVAAVDGRNAVLALNRIGLARIGIDPVRHRYRLEGPGAGAEFKGRSVGGLFRRGDSLFCLLFRDPVFETEPVRDPPSALLTLGAADPVDQARPTDLGLGPEGGDLFAVFPQPDGTWALQLRREVPQGFESSFRSYDYASGMVSGLTRSEFEKIFVPRLLSSAPESLRRAARLLAPEGAPVVVSVALEDGSRAVYSFGDGKPEDTVELRGAVTESGAALISWNAVAAVAREGAESAFHLPVPVPGAVYRDVVLLEGAVLAIWESGDFPNIADSGALLLPAP